MVDSHKRSVIKAVSWRVIATFTTMSIVFIFTRELVLSLEVGVCEVLAKMSFYYFHERIWDKVKWGKMPHPLEKLKVTRQLDTRDMDKIKQQLQDMGYLD